MGITGMGTDSLFGTHGHMYTHIHQTCTNDGRFGLVMHQDVTGNLGTGTCTLHFKKSMCSCICCGQH